jgi:hypothetical protein
LEAQNPQPSEEKPAEKAETKAEVKAEEESGYKPSEKEKHLYHVELEKPLFDKTTGKKLSKPVVQKFTKAEYNQLVGKKNEKDKSNAEMLGYIVNVLYKPE